MNFSPDQMRQLIIGALFEHSDILGAAGESLFERGFDEALDENSIQNINEPIREQPHSSWQIEISSNPVIQRSIPALTPASYFDDGVMRYPENMNPHPIIQYQMNDDFNSLIYLGHEVGHAIADTIAREARQNPLEMPHSIAEVQAYFVQNALYNSLSRMNPRLEALSNQHMMDIANPADLPVIFEKHANSVGNNRAIDFSIARTLFLHSQKNPNEHSEITMSLMGANGVAAANAILLKGLELQQFESPTINNRKADINTRFPS